MGEEEPAQLNLTTTPGLHRPRLSFAPDFEKSLVRLAAGNASENYTAARARAHQRAIAELVSVSCPCAQESCGFATTTILGFIEGLRIASRHYARQAPRRHADPYHYAQSPLLGPPKVEVNLVMPTELAVTMKTPPSRGVDVIYEGDKVVGTRPADPRR